MTGARKTYGTGWCMVLYGTAGMAEARKTPVITGKLFTALSLSPHSLAPCLHSVLSNLCCIVHIVDCTFQQWAFIPAHVMYSCNASFPTNTSNSCTADMLLEIHCCVSAQSFPLLRIRQCRRVEFHSDIQKQQLDRHFRAGEPD